ncbi:amino acid dehydrogenase [Paenibacillus selenitireducens]|uniref:Amino acid dehydrogenase n=1 Tax=Paenibacillus selenitireducens TaxID=1324314 RepID=A0A1T2XD32_9BACL|nr:VWA domain-containing protein [Paenibacillus selenitireducens]OPA77791.1 amino acid dehydrogenase [Paenibacillus selenitireducens]
MIRRSIFIFVTLIVILAGCSNEPEKNSSKIQNPTDSNQSNEPEKNSNEPEKNSNEPEKNTSKIQTPSDSNQRKPQTPLTDEQILMKPPGRFAGSNFDEQKVQAVLDELSTDLTADQYEEELLLLLAEDYRPYVSTFLNFESEVTVNNPRPNEKVTLPSSRKLHISILLDASGSMKATINGKSKMDSAKEAIQSFTDKLPKNAEVSLRVYGHKGTGSQKDKQVSCNSTEEIFHGQGEQTNQIKTVLQDIKPAGWTPIANALKSVKQDINPETTDSIVYVVSDGIETCGGNPAQIAKELHQSKVKTIVNIIGFDVDKEGQKLLRQVAASGGGEFTFVDNDEALKNYLNKTYDKLRGEWTIWKEKGEGQANIQKEQKQGTINSTQETMQGLANKENSNLLAALKYLKTKKEDDFPHSELLKKITERKNFAWNYARDTGKRLYAEVSKSGNQVYDDIKDEGNKNIDDLTNKKNN